MVIKRKKSEIVSVERKVFHDIMDGLKANIYVTDVDTDEIIFMNKTMKEDFGLESPEGQICWKILQSGRSQRCDFCPVNWLKQKKEENVVYQWDECNTVTHREYRNYDCLLEWVDGRKAHLQQSIDVTELNQANLDELTGFFTRKYGKKKLDELLTWAKVENQLVTICLYDINLLKQVNDMYGHSQGDDLIACIAECMGSKLNPFEFGFRLSGDEFAVVLLSGQKEAQKRIEEIRKEIIQLECDVQMGFCYGSAEFSADFPATMDELLFLADRRMYEEKRAFHIEQNKLQFNRFEDVDLLDSFQYDHSRLYDALMKSTDDYIYICNMKTGVFRYSAQMVEDFDLPSQTIENAAAIWGAKVHPEDKAAFLESNQEIYDGRTTDHCVEYRAKNREGDWVWVRCRGHLELDEFGEPLLFAGFITNLGGKNTVDHLTGFFNKLKFREQIEAFIGNHQPFSMMLLGIDGLKQINDLYDRTFGDDVIRLVSQRIRSTLPTGVRVYRLDGDVFGIIAGGADQEGMESLYRRVNQQFKGQQVFDGKKYSCTLSGGCIFYPNNAESYEDLIKSANYCMELSKKKGKNRCTYYTQDMLDERTRALMLTELLRESVENQFRGFRLVYQPLVHAQTGEIVGAEALARWECKEFGQISPMEFIPLLESTGLIVAVGEWILSTALRTSKQWIAQDPDFMIDVNISYLQIQEPNFLEMLKGVLIKERFKPSNLVLELTESYFIQVNEEVHQIFHAIRAMGILIAMDDFGTGYSTLGILKEAPTDIVKIDKTFIRDIGDCLFDETFIRFIVELCHNVGIRVCLEGIETRKGYDIVSPMKLDLIQGYLFDRPLEEEIFTKKYF